MMKKNQNKQKRISVLLAAAAAAAVLTMGTLFLLMRITQKMNNSANETLITSSRMIKEGIESKMESDEEVLAAFANLLAADGIEDVKGCLKSYHEASDFFNLIYMDEKGNGVDSLGNEVKLSELPFDESVFSGHGDGISRAYNGDSGHVQIAFQKELRINGKRTGAIYGQKILNTYKDPSLFSFMNGNGRAYLVKEQDGSWLIEGRGAKGTENIYDYLEQEGNAETVREALKNHISQGNSGTIAVTCAGRENLLCFVSMDKIKEGYLISIIPKEVLQREASTVIRMIRAMLVLLLTAAVFILLLLLGRQSMKAKAAQKEYREKLFQNLSANIDFAFLLYTPSKQRTELVSDNLQDLIGTESQEMSSADAIFDRCGIEKEDEDRKAFLSGHLKKQIVRECRIGTETNELTRWINVHLIPADYGQVLMVLNDTTKDHHMRENLADALEQARSTNEARTAFFSSMSHDLRTPMNGIIGMTGIAIANIENPGKVKSCLNKIMSASDHLLALINEILDMSRIESGKLSLKEEEVHLPSMISNILEFISPELKKKSQELKLKAPVLTYDTVLGDSLHLQKVLLNILSNAVKYTPEGGTVCLSISETYTGAGCVQICFIVEDNGIGMSREFQKRLFMPFEREEDNRSSRTAGTGLGMAIVKGIVDRMEGEITVESEENKGSKFVVKLPLKCVNQKETEIFGLTGYRVLVVDDEKDSCESISLILQEAGLSASWVLSGEEAVEEIKKAHEMKNDFFAVILDWKMPRMDGLETARRIREVEEKGIPIILLSAYNWENVEEEAVRIGINGFLTKPIFKNQLLEKLNCYSGSGKMPDTEEAPDEAVEIPDLSSLKILIAEDNELNREVITEVLTACGACVVGAENGEEVSRRFMESAPGEYQMILMDVHMPEMDGLKATRVIRSSAHPDAAQIPVIAMTADVFHEDIRKCMEAGMNAHLGKPIEVRKLYEKIRQYALR